MRCKSSYFISLCLLVFTLPIFAWNAGGHEVIAQIAYDNLTPAVRQKVNHILKARFISKYNDGRFLFAATWPDRIKNKTKKYNAWHYIGLPIVKDDVMPPPLNKRNVVWAIEHSERIVTHKNDALKKRAKYLSFLIHFVGDIHQPLHCATLYSKKFPPPQGDLGGNKYFIKSNIANNLHAYWDRGLGLLINRRGGNYLNYYQVNQRANHWMKAFPKSFFAKKLQVKNPAEWAQESHALAKQYAYAMPENTAPMPAYISNGKRVVKEQVVLAGYRLADVLNRTFS